MLLDRLQSLVATGQFLAAYREVERLAMDPELDPALRAKVYMVGVRAAAGLREVYAAAKLAEKAIEAAELGTDWEDIGNARLHSALIYRELGDTALALRFFRLFLDYLDRYPSLEQKRAHAFYNLGLTHQQRREYLESLQAFDIAAQQFEELGHQSLVLASLQNSAWVLLLQGQVAEAEPLIARADHLCTQLAEPEYQVSQLIVEALHARLTGNIEQAVTLCEEVFQPRRPGTSDSHRAEAAWIMAHLTLEAGRLAEARIFVDLATSYALQAKEPQLMNLASEVRQLSLHKQSQLSG